MELDDLDILQYLKEADWENIKSSNTTFTPSLVEILMNKLTLYKEAVDVILRGELTGYEIECPHCKVAYSIWLNELNYKKLVTCMDCGNKYYQNQNIAKIIQRED